MGLPAAPLSRLRPFGALAKPGCGGLRPGGFGYASQAGAVPSDGFVTEAGSEFEQAPVRNASSLRAVTELREGAPALPFWPSLAPNPAPAALRHQPGSPCRRAPRVRKDRESLCDPRRAFRLPSLFSLKAVGVQRCLLAS